jgi:hypothetical protein
VATTEISKTLLSTNMSQLGLKVATRFRSQFKTDSAPHRLVLLQFGAPLFVGGKLGVTLTPGNPVPNPAGADIDTVKGYVTGFADGYIHAYRDYWNQLPTLYIGVGTSNDGSLNVDEMRRHGRAWGAMINSINLDLEQKFQDLQLSRKIFAFGANDMELGWNDPAHTLAWIEGYKSTAWSSLIDSGNTDCVYSTGHCINGWELDKVLEKVIGDGRTWAVPQIYHTNGNDAVQWANLWKYSGGKPPSIRGVLTTYQACQQSETQDPLCNGVINNKPEDAWQSLRSKVTETLPSCSNWQGPHLLTDIRYFRSSKNPPWADLIRVNWPAQKAAHEILTITWEAGDPDGDPLFYEILYMPTETRLISLGTVTGTMITVNLSDLPGSSAARIMVVANDSFHFTTATSEPFAVAPKPPRVNILAPASEAVLPPGQSVQLLGYAEDPEDGILPDAALSWYSNRDGFLGTGGQVLVTLSYGQHVITLRTIDSDGNTATASVNVFVGSRIYLPVIQKEFEGISPPNIYLPIILR